MTVNTEVSVGGTVFADARDLTVRSAISENSASSRAEATFDNTDGRNKSSFTVGDSFVVKAQQNVFPATTTIFNGLLEEVRFEGKGSSYERVYLLARDYVSLLMRSYVEPEVYTNTEVSAIVLDIMDKYGPSNVTTTNVDSTGVTLSRIQFKQITIFEALKQLAEMVDFFFYIDVNLDLHFEVKNSTSSGVTLDNTNVTKSSFVTNIDKVKNRVFVYGNRHLVHRPQESFTSDGAGSVFTLTDNPHNTQVKSSGLDQTGDIFKSATSVPSSGVNYLVNFHDKQVVFVSGTDLGYSSIPASGVSVTVDYEVTRPIIKFARDSSSINLYGARTEVIVDTNIQDPSVATEIARSRLSLLKNPVVEGDIYTQGVVSLTAGNTVIVNLPNQNQSSVTYEVLEVVYDFSPNNVVAEEVLKVKVSRKVEGAVDVLKQLVMDVARLRAEQIDITGVLSRLELATGSFGLSIKEWQVKTRTVGDSFIIGRSLLGSIHDYSGTSQFAKGTKSPNVSTSSSGIVWG